MSDDALHLAFACLYPPRAVLRGSGTSHHLIAALEAAGHTVTAIHADAEANGQPLARPFLTRALRAAARRTGRRYRSHQDPWIARRLAQRAADVLDARLANGRPIDAFLTNDHGIAGWLPASRRAGRAPRILITDALFPRDYGRNVHPWLDGLAPWSVWACQRVNARGLARCDRVALASHWAVDEARRYGAARADAITCLPYGANLPPRLPDPDDPARLLPAAAEVPDDRAARLARDGAPLALLFIGGDWWVKDGETVVDTVLALHARGLDARLHLLAPPPAASPAVARLRTRGFGGRLTVHPAVDKRLPGDLARLVALYQRCDVLFVPSRAEGFGLVYAEAARFGLPSLARRTTGVTTAVADGASGALLDADADADAFADVLADWHARPGRYAALARGARQHYDTTVNWPTAARRLTDQIRAAIAARVAGYANEDP